MSTHSNNLQAGEWTADDQAPAGIRAYTCYAVFCTVCGTDTDIDDEYTPHFPTRADALAYWTNPGGGTQNWTVGPTGIRCPACTCAAAGHVWAELFAGTVQCRRCLHMEPRDDSATKPLLRGERP